MKKTKIGEIPSFDKLKRDEYVLAKKVSNQDNASDNKAASGGDKATGVVYKVKTGTGGIFRMPNIRAGVCEFCGLSYKECQHYKDVNIVCSYCLRGDIIQERILEVYKNDKNELIIHCNDFDCHNRFNKEFFPQASTDLPSV